MLSASGPFSQTLRLTQSHASPILHLLLSLVQTPKPVDHRRDPTPTFPRGLPGWLEKGRAGRVHGEYLLAPFAHFPFCSFFSFSYSSTTYYLLYIDCISYVLTACACLGLPCFSAHIHICTSMHYQQHASSTAYVRAPCILNPPKKKKPGVRVSEASSVSGLLNKKKRWRRPAERRTWQEQEKPATWRVWWNFMSKLKKKKGTEGEKKSSHHENTFFPPSSLPAGSCFLCVCWKHRAPPKTVLFCPQPHNYFSLFFLRTLFFFYFAFVSLSLGFYAFLSFFLLPVLFAETDASSDKIIAHSVSSFIHERRSSSAKEHNIHISF